MMIPRQLARKMSSTLAGAAAAAAFGGTPGRAAALDWSAGHKGVSVRRKGPTVLVRDAKDIRTFTSLELLRVDALKMDGAGDCNWIVEYHFYGRERCMLRGLSGDEAESLVEHMLSLGDDCDD